MITRCLNPQFITKDGLDQRVDCGKCHNCRRKIARTWQGKGLLEYRRPYYPEHRDPKTHHWVTLTYAEAPMTTPRKHVLGWSTDSEGNECPWNGPFVKRPEQYGREGRQVTKRNGVPVWSDTGDFLDEDELANEHYIYLTHRLGWNDAQVDRWIEGDYEPEMTTSVKDVQKFLDRLRKDHSRNQGAEAPLRYLWATEYGGALGRPHIHLMLFGLHVDNVHKIYQYWSDFNENYGHVHPSLYDAKRDHATLMTDQRASLYMAKDIAKMDHIFTGTPGMYEVEKPRVRGSKHPPIGDGAYDWWFEKYIGGLLAAAEKTNPFGIDECDENGIPMREIYAVKLLRANYATVSIPMYTKKGKTERFPSSITWRNRVRQDLQISQELWDAASREIARENHDQVQLIRQNVDGLGDEHDKYIQELRAQDEENQRRKAEKIKLKRSKLRATGKL